MKLKDIITDIHCITDVKNEELEVSSVALDSRKVQKGALFFALRGEKMDGHDFIDAAIENGAVAIVCEAIPGEPKDGVEYIQVDEDEGVPHVMGAMVANFYGNPSRELKVVGITGTNGKTTTVSILDQVFRKLGYKVGVFGTTGDTINGELIERERATASTPDVIDLQHGLSEMRDAGCTHVFMEVTSHGLDQGRLDGTIFTGALFSNITQDHLDYHNTFEEYLEAKRTFFKILPSSAFALANADDDNGAFMLQDTAASKYFYSLKDSADIQGKLVANHFDGIHIELDGYEVHVPLIGAFNAYNTLVAYGAAKLLGENIERVREHLTTIESVPGRFEKFEINGRIGIVDYAHTPDALESVLETIAEIKSKNQKVISVVGCAGDRDPGKRPKMARIGYRLSDYLVITSDNPRTEDPEAILRDMEDGLDDPHQDPKVATIVDRTKAIILAVAKSEPGDIVLVAGKGHEDYQDVAGEKHYFSDREELVQHLGTIV